MKSLRVRWWLPLGMVMAGLPALASPAEKPETEPLKTRTCPNAGEAAVTKLLVPIRQKHHLPANPDLIRYGGADGRQERLRVVQNALSKTLAHPPGTQYLYSNLGYSLVGAIHRQDLGGSHARRSIQPARHDHRGFWQDRHARPCRTSLGATQQTATRSAEMGRPWIIRRCWAQPAGSTARFRIGASS